MYVTQYVTLALFRPLQEGIVNNINQMLQDIIKDMNFPDLKSKTCYGTMQTSQNHPSNFCADM
jgi:hypothetical protein